MTKACISRPGGYGARPVGGWPENWLRKRPQPQTPPKPSLQRGTEARPARKPRPRPGFCRKTPFRWRPTAEIRRAGGKATRAMETLFSSMDLPPGVHLDKRLLFQRIVSARALAEAACRRLVRKNVNSCTEAPLFFAQSTMVRTRRLTGRPKRGLQRGNQPAVRIPTQPAVRHPVPTRRSVPGAQTGCRSAVRTSYSGLRAER